LLMWEGDVGAVHVPVPAVSISQFQRSRRFGFQRSRT
jgi:hypothetical protein